MENVSTSAETEAETTASVQTPAFVHAALINIAVNHGLIVYTINVIPAGTGADGFMAEILRATITDIESDTVRLRLIVKLMPTSPLRLQMSSALFKREVQFYLNVWPEMEKFQRRKLKIGIKKFAALPKCYFAHYNDERMESAIILQDMCESDFIAESARDTVTYGHARFVMKHLARLHAITFALRDQRPTLFHQLKLSENISALFRSEILRSMFAINVDKGLELLDDSYYFYERCTAIHIRQYTKNMKTELARLNDGRLSDPFSVFIHGDLWTNNLLFKYQNGRAADICFIDWQLMRYASPAIDLLQYIYMCTDQSVRHNHFNDLLSRYHHKLSLRLSAFGSNADRLYPFARLQQDMKTFAKCALGTCLLAMPMLTMPRGQAIDMAELSKRFTNAAKLDRDDTMRAALAQSPVAKLNYSIRMADIIGDMAQRGFL